MFLIGVTRPTLVTLPTLDIFINFSTKNKNKKQKIKKKEKKEEDYVTPIKPFFLGLTYTIFNICVFCQCSANNYAMKGKRKTLHATDVLNAMKDMEFEEFVEPLEHSLEGRYCESLTITNTEGEIFKPGRNLTSLITVGQE